MEVIGIIILCVTLLAFAGFFIYYIWGCNKPTYPAGKVLTTTYDGFTVDVVAKEGKGSIDYLGDHLVTMCMHAVRATAHAWPSVPEAKKKLKHVVVHFANAETFKLLNYKDPKSIAGFPDMCRMKFGPKYWPMPVIKASLAFETLKTGEPLIHELLHILLKQYKISTTGDHTEQKVWAKFDKQRGVVTAQTKARILFKQYTKNAQC